VYGLNSISHSLSLTLSLSHAWHTLKKKTLTLHRVKAQRATENLGRDSRETPKLLVSNGPLIAFFFAPFQEHSEVRKGRWKRRNLTDLLRKMKNVQNKVASINELNTPSLVICKQTVFDLGKLTFERRMFCLFVYMLCCTEIKSSSNGRIIHLFWVTECNIVIERAVWAHLKK
jgi:hypothetical protein